MTDQAVPLPAEAKAPAPRIPTSPKLRPLARLLPFILAYPWRLGLTILFLLISTIASLAIPAMLGGVVDQGFVEKNLQSVANYGYLIVGIAAIMGVASGARFYFISVL